MKLEALQQMLELRDVLYTRFLVAFPSMFFLELFAVVRGTFLVLSLSSPLLRFQQSVCLWS